MRPRYLCMLVVSALALIYLAVSPCSGDSTGSTIINAVVPSSLTITVPAGVSGWSLDPDIDNEKQYTSPTTDGKLRGASNNQGGFQVTAIDNLYTTKGSYSGFMQSGGNFLHNHLKIDLWNTPYSGTPTEKALNSQTQVQMFDHGGTRGETTKYVSWKNQGSWNDVPDSSYQITIKFTISNYP